MSKTMAVFVCSRGFSIVWLTTLRKKDILKSPSSWGASGTLYLQSAIVGVISGPGYSPVELPFISGVDVLGLAQ